MIRPTTESLLFFWTQAGEHPAEHLFTVDERGCVADVITASPGYIALRQKVADSDCESFIPAQSSVDLFMLHRSLVAEYPVRAGERHSIAEIIDTAQGLISQGSRAQPPASDEVCHGYSF